MTQPVEMIQTNMVPNQEELHAFRKKWHTYSGSTLREREREREHTAPKIVHYLTADIDI